MTVTEADLVFSGEILLDPGNCPVRVFQAEAPHTDDSTLIHVPGEGVLFIGDAGCGALPDWKKDPALAQKLADTVRGTGAALCVDGHWEPLNNEDAVQSILTEE